MNPDSSTAKAPPFIANSNGHDDQRVAAFCSALHPGLFHAVAYGTDIWRQDPFDVKSIHGSVRDTLANLVDRVRSRLPCRRAGCCYCWEIPEAARRT